MMLDEPKVFKEIKEICFISREVSELSQKSSISEEYAKSLLSSLQSHCRNLILFLSFSEKKLSDFGLAVDFNDYVASMK